MGRKRWSVEERRRIVELTLLPGASAARVAQAEGVNANQVFLWRRAYRTGDLPPGDSKALLPVVVEAEANSERRFPGDARALNCTRREQVLQICHLVEPSRGPDAHSLL